MIRKDLRVQRREAVRGDTEHEHRCAIRNQHRDAAMSRLVPPWMKIVDPRDEADYDPYNTGAFRVLAEPLRRRSLDDMRKLDEQIRRWRRL